MWMRLQEQAWKGRRYAILAGDPAAERLEAWADDVTAETTKTAPSTIRPIYHRDAGRNIAEAAVMSTFRVSFLPRQPV
jgi:hypothetical protein